jgi:hypothetical protein
MELIVNLNDRVNLNFSRSIQNNPNITYRWHHNGRYIKNANYPTYTIEQANKNNEGDYYCVANDGVNSKKDDTITLIVNSKMEIVEFSPLFHKKTVGSNVMFFVNVKGNYPFKYQWFKYIETSETEVKLNDEIDNIFKINKITYTDNAKYFVKITDKNNITLTSDYVTLVVNNHPSIKSQSVENIYATIGEKIELSVEITNDSLLSLPLTYRWYFIKGRFIRKNAFTSNELINKYSINNFQLTNEGTYFVEITDNSLIAIKSEYINVKLLIETTIQNNLTGVELLEGDKHTLSITTTGKEPLNYIWYKDEIAIKNTKENNYTFDSARIGDSGVYYVKIQLSDNTFIKSNSVYVSIYINPTLINNTIKYEKTETLSVGFYASLVNYNKYNNYICEWYRNNEVVYIDGQNIRATTSYKQNEIIYRLYTQKLTYMANQQNSFIYKAVIKNVTDNKFLVESRGIELLVNPLLKIKTITQGPILLQDTGVLNIEMKIIGGTPPYKYYWYIEKIIDGLKYYLLLYNNTNIYNKSTLDANVDTGVYYLIVKDKSNFTAISNKVEVNVATKLSIIQNPISKIAIVSGFVEFSVSNKGYYPYYYEWYHNGKLIYSNNTSKYTIKYTTKQYAGDYYVVIYSGKNREFKITSSSALLDVYDTPFIYKQPPKMLDIYKNTNVILNVEAYGYNTLNYQWFYNNAIIPNANNANYIIQNATKDNEGKYLVNIMYKNKYTKRDITLISDYVELKITDIICFKENTKILTSKGYIPIQNLKKGDLVKTLKNDYKPIKLIGSKQIYHNCLKERIRNQLYKCSKDQYPELFEDLIITGGHSILVDKFIDSRQKNKTIEINGMIRKVDDKYLLPVCADYKSSVYEKEGNYIIYHLYLQNENTNLKYGIYANGLLVETCDKKQMCEFTQVN